MDTTTVKVQKEWKEITQREPRLLALYERARATQDDKTKEWFCANQIWYRQLKPELVELVGSARTDDAILGTCRAYDVAYHTVYNALPDCRGNCPDVMILQTAEEMGWNVVRIERI